MRASISSRPDWLQTKSLHWGRLASSSISASESPDTKKKKDERNERSPLDKTGSLYNTSAWFTRDERRHRPQCLIYLLKLEVQWRRDDSLACLDALLTSRTLLSRSSSFSCASRSLSTPSSLLISSAANFSGSTWISFGIRLVRWWEDNAGQYSRSPFTFNAMPFKTKLRLLIKQ